MLLLARRLPQAHDAPISVWLALYFLQAALINFALAYEFSIFYAFAFGCVLALSWRVSPWLHRGINLLSSLLAAGYFPFGRAFGPPDFNMLLALHSTHWQESTAAITVFPWQHYGMQFIVLGLAACALCRRSQHRQDWRRLDIALLSVAAIAFVQVPVENYVSGLGLKLKESGYPVVRFVKDSWENHRQVIEQRARMLSLAQAAPEWKVTQSNPRYRTYVVVIGESARRDALAAFGGQWNNTPFASNVPGTFFMDYVAASGSTQKSLGLTLSRVVAGKPEYHNNFLTLAQTAGFTTWWFSNQGQIGAYDTAIASIAKRADHVHFFKEGNFEEASAHVDSELLALAATAIAQPSNAPRLIVLHLMGSHPPACERTGGRYTTFVQSRETSCYLHSIRQTDDLLRDLYAQLKRQGESFSLLYFSDHGLAFKERGTAEQYLAHGDTYQQNFQVPFMVLSSDDSSRRQVQASRSAKEFLHFFREWTGIATSDPVAPYAFTSEDSAGPIFVTNFKLQRVRYRQLESDAFSAQLQGLSPRAVALATSNH